MSEQLTIEQAVRILNEVKYRSHADWQYNYRAVWWGESAHHLGHRDAIAIATGIINTRALAEATAKIEQLELKLSVLEPDLAQLTTDNDQQAISLSEMEVEIERLGDKLLGQQKTLIEARERIRELEHVNEMKRDEAARWFLSKGFVPAEQLNDLQRAVEQLRAENAELQRLQDNLGKHYNDRVAELANSVPRSRYDAADLQWEETKVELQRVRQVAKEEIAALEQRLTELRAENDTLKRLSIATVEDAERQEKTLAELRAECDQAKQYLEYLMAATDDSDDATLVAENCLLTAQLAELRAERDSAQKRFEASSGLAAERGCQISEMQETLAALRSAAEWQPIETAPRDCTVFHAYAKELIHPDYNPWGIVEAVFDGDSEFIGAVWWDDEWHTQVIHPTHWRRFPEPPCRPRRRKEG